MKRSTLKNAMIAIATILGFLTASGLTLPFHSTAEGGLGEANLLLHADPARAGRPLVTIIVNRLGDRLDLTSKQKDAIKEIVQSEMASISLCLATLRTNREELESITEEGRYNETQVRVIAEHQGKSIAELIVIKERLKAQIHPILTPEQQEKLQEFTTRLEARMQKLLTLRR